MKHVQIPGPFHTLEQIKRANQQNGGHYFDKDAVRFFRSRPNAEVIYGRFFIDSIQFVASDGTKAPREYKVVLVDDDGSTHNVVVAPEGWDGTTRRIQTEDWQERFISLRSARIFATSLLLDPLYNHRPAVAEVK